MDGGIIYFQTICTAFSSQTLVELTDVSGVSYFYASTIVKNPGPLTADTVSNTTAGINRRTAVLDMGSKKVHTCPLILYLHFKYHLMLITGNVRL